MGDDVVPFKRKRVDKDGYIVEETWVQIGDKGAMPLSDLSWHISSSDFEDLLKGKPISSTRISLRNTFYEKLKYWNKRNLER